MAIVHNNSPRGWVDRFKAKTLHLVCVATGGLTTCDFAASTLGGLRQEEEVWPLTKKVNCLGETGTFWPRLLLTVIPLSRWEGRSESGDLEGFYRRCFLDVAKANRDYIKLDEMYVDLSGCDRGHDLTTARRIAEDVLSHETSIKVLYFSLEPA